MSENVIHWPDWVVIGVFISVILYIGKVSSAKTKSADAYFLAKESLPGWVVGFSLMATLISSMSFLAAPGFSYRENWRYMPNTFIFIIIILMGIYLFMPIFRKANLHSGYEYLEKRFGTGARLYAAFGYVLAQIARLGLILYTVSLPVQVMTGLKLELVIIVFGIIIATYTIMGGLEAVIWTDLIQGLALMIGAFICLPVIIHHMPGGLSQIISVAYADGKMSVGSLDFNFQEKTLWVMMLAAIFNGIWCVEQSTVQRYIAPKTSKQAKTSLIVAGLTVIPIWLYFNFIGTAMYVFYKQFPDPAVDEMVAEQIMPYFILSQIPTGLSGFVIIGLLTAAMSSLDSSINAAASTVTNDFYRRLMVKNKSESHYAVAGKWFSVFFGAIMILLALFIHYARTQTIQDISFLLKQIFAAGIYGIFILGVLSTRAGKKPTLIALVLTVALVLVWLFLDSPMGQAMFPSLVGLMPNKLWTAVFANFFLVIVAYTFSFLSKKTPGRDLTNLTLWTIK